MHESILSGLSVRLGYNCLIGYPHLWSIVYIEFSDCGLLLSAKEYRSFGVQKVPSGTKDRSVIGEAEPGYLKQDVRLR